jgi:magnesium transporter
MSTEQSFRAPSLQEQLSDLLAAGARAPVRSFMAGLEPLDTVHVVSRLKDEERANLLVLLRPEDAAHVIEHIPEVQATGALESMHPARAARILGELPSDDRADLLNEIEDEDAEAILARMAPDSARELRELASYAGDTAGGMMIHEYVDFRADETAGAVLDHLHEHAETYRSYDVQYTFVRDERGHLVGVLPLRDLLFTKRATPIEQLMVRDPKAVRVDAGLQELVAFFERHRFYGVPVVDEDGLLVGVLRRRAVESAVAERSEADFRASQGIVGGEELRSMPLLVRSGRRLSWLSVNIALNVLAASIIAYHQETLQAVIALAVFLPIISDMSGCSGAQAVAVSMRELTLGVTRPADIVRVLRQELWVGLVNGLALGVLIALVAWAWKGNPWLGVVVGGALALNTVVAVCVGGGVPLALKRLGRDPALASGPILTTVTDMCGFLLVLTFASAMLGRLS